MIKQVAPRGYKVCKSDEPDRCFSNKPIPKKTAEKQRVAIIISEKSRQKPTQKPKSKPKNNVAI
jgi:hypothetical protein